MRKIFLIAFLSTSLNCYSGGFTNQSPPQEQIQQEQIQKKEIKHPHNDNDLYYWIGGGLVSSFLFIGYLLKTKKFKINDIKIKLGFIEVNVEKEDENINKKD